MKGYFRKGLVFGIIFLFLGAGVFPTISGQIENNAKEDLSESNFQLPPEPSYMIIGIMQIINSTSEYLEAKAIFTFIKIGSDIGLLESGVTFRLMSFEGFAKLSIVNGKCTDITTPYYP